MAVETGRHVVLVNLDRIYEVRRSQTNVVTLKAFCCNAPVANTGLVRSHESIVRAD